MKSENRSGILSVDDEIILSHDHFFSWLHPDNHRSRSATEKEAASLSY